MPATRHVNPATAMLVVVTSDPSCVRTRLLNIVPRDPHVLAASIGGLRACSTLAAKSEP
jgi:hypothetical protein